MTPATAIRARAGHAPLKAERIQTERAELLALRASNLHLLPSIMDKFDAAFQEVSGNGWHRWGAFKGQIQQEVADLMLMYDVAHILLDAGYYVGIYCIYETPQYNVPVGTLCQQELTNQQENHVLMKGWRLSVSWHPNELQYYRDNERSIPFATKCGIHVHDPISKEDETTMCEMMQVVGELRRNEKSKQ